MHSLVISTLGIISLYDSRKFRKKMKKQTVRLAFMVTIFFAGIFAIVHANTDATNVSSSSSWSESTSSSSVSVDVSVTSVSSSSHDSHDGDSCRDDKDGDDHDDDCGDDDDDDTGGKLPQGSITVCKIIVDENGNVLTADIPSGAIFEVFGINPSIHGTQPNAVGIIATSTFTTPLQLNKKILDASMQNDAHCVTYDHLKLGDYYYGEESLPNTGWLPPKYNDGYSVKIHSTADFFSYSGELFTANPTDDASRNKNADGDIVLTKDRPARTLVVLNTYKKTYPPKPEQGKLKVCKWNDQTGDGKNSTSTDDVPLANWNFDIKNATSSEAVWHLLTQESDGCALSDLIDAGNYSINEETRQDWNLTGVYVNGDKVNNVPVSTTTDVIANVLKGATTRVDFYNHHETPATTTPAITISATKIVCDHESDLPNWGNGGPDIASTTATIWVADHSGCHLTPGWKFQYASSTAPNPGDQVGEAIGWNTFGPTNDQGVATTTITDSNLLGSPRVWVREEMQNGYIPFAGVGATTTVSAEMYCAQDVLNYDNYDFIANPKAGNIYSCVAWNVKNVTPPPAAQCSDGIDNDHDGKIDAADPACHTDNDPNNPVSYNPNNNSENEKPIITLIGDATTTITVGDVFTDPGATAQDPEDGDITSSIIASSTIATSTVGTYSVVYNVADSEGLAADPVTRTVVVKDKTTPPPPDGGGGGGGGGCVTNCGGGGGGGNGPIVPTALSISNESVLPMSANSALVSWDTNLGATSQVFYDITSHATGIAPMYGYASSTVLVTAETVHHVILVSGLRGGPPYYFRPYSATGSTSAVGKELIVTLPIVGGQCSYLKDYLRLGAQNDPAEVNKLQYFLKTFEGFNNLAITGVFDQSTFDAVSAFQQKYKTDVLDPWGYNEPTGYVYITTKKKVNEIYCKTAFPLTLQQLSEIDAFRTLLERGGTIPNPSETIGSTERGGTGTGGVGTSTGLAAGIQAPKNGSQRESSPTTNISSTTAMVDTGIAQSITPGNRLAALAAQTKVFVSSKMFIIPVLLILVAIALILILRRKDSPQA
jgi:hypothetical protein